MSGIEYRAIETVYRGYRFRSRLEARWAVFLDALEVPFEYEAQGFDVSGTWYLPDFWLPRWDAFLEVRPTTDKVLDTFTQERLAVATGKHVIFVVGDPVEVFMPSLTTVRTGHHACLAIFDRSGVAAGDVIASMCRPPCSRATFRFAVSKDFLVARYLGADPHDVGPGCSSERYDLIDVHDAAMAARQARFEHGESGVPHVGSSSRGPRAR